MPEQPSSALLFGPFRLAPAESRLWRDGQIVALQPKALTILQYLAERPSHLATKDELLAAGWPGVFVSEAALKVCVREIRRVLEDDASHPLYIETVHRRGYRFVASVTTAATPRRAPTGALPQTHYAHSGNVNIAYQVVGSGPVDLVFVMGWVSHLDYFWAEPSFAAFLQRLAGFSRLILFDKRGTGLSDPVSTMPTLEQRMDDVRAVLEAVESRDAILFGVSEGGPMCALFAATYPERTRGLVMFGTYAQRYWTADYPWAPTREQRERFYAEIHEQWGGPVGIAERAPSRADDPVFRDWWATYLRMGASPGTALALSRMNAEIDVRHVLPTIDVPTLVLHRKGDRCLKIDEGRYVAGHIPGARLVELEGEDHLPFVGDTDALIAEIERFVRETAQRPAASRMLATVLIASVSSSAAAVAPAVDRFVEEARVQLSALRGAHIETSQSSVQAAFDGPARGIAAARMLAPLARGHALKIRVGLHTGECELTNGNIRGVAVDIARRVAEHASPGEILASRTLRDLVAGSGLQFTDRGAHTLGPLGERWRLFAV